ncbi:MAG: hypothetical protein R3D62_20295 [Xanthobacteraceae bacterium]
MIALSSCWPGPELRAEPIDIIAYFQRVQGTRGAGLARKTKPVDVRPATPGEVVVTIIKGEGKETESPPAKSGDMVVRNRCPETGNEQILVSAASFAQRYEGPIGAEASDGWTPYRPRGVQMRFVTVAAEDGAFTFTAPWGEQMVARPGDAIVQDLNNPKNIYRIAKAAFACTYEVLREPQP